MTTCFWNYMHDSILYSILLKQCQLTHLKSLICLGHILQRPWQSSFSNCQVTLCVPRTSLKEQLSWPQFFKYFGLGDKRLIKLDTIPRLCQDLLLFNCILRSLKNMVLVRSPQKVFQQSSLQILGISLMPVNWIYSCHRILMHKSLSHSIQHFSSFYL